MCSRSAYGWTDFGEQAAVSLGYCRGGRKLLVFLVLLDPSGVTATGGGITVIHQPEHQLPIAVVTFEHPAYARHPAAAAMAQQLAAANPFGAMNPFGAGFGANFFGGGLGANPAALFGGAAAPFSGPGHALGGAGLSAPAAPPVQWPVISMNHPSQARMPAALANGRRPPAASKRKRSTPPPAPRNERAQAGGGRRPGESHHAYLMRLARG